MSCAVPEAEVIITRNHDDTVYDGTTLTLTANITFSDLTGADVPLSLDISWTRDDDVINCDTRIIVSTVTSSGTSYTATLIYSPITTDDSGQVTASVTITPSVESQYIQSVTVMALEVRLDVQGIYILHVIITGRSHHFPHTYTELPDPVVNVTPDITMTAGDELQLTCTVITVNNFVASSLVTVQWSGGSVGSSGVTESITTTNGVTSMKTLTFNPLYTSITWS